MALGVTGCDSGGGGDSGTDGGSSSSGSTGSPTTDPGTTNPTTGNPSTTGEPGTTTGEPGTTTGDASSSTGEPTTGADSSSTGDASSSSSSTGTENLCPNGAEATEVDDHPHGLTIPADQLQPGTPLMGLTMSGGHPHTIDLTADDVDTLLGGQSVTVTSSFDSGHDHQVTIGCS